MNNQPTPTEINIGDILRLALPLSTTVSAGARHARRNVKWAVLLTSWKDLEDQVEQSDLLVVPPILEQQTTTETLLGLLEKMVELEVAGLLVFKDVQEEVAEKASALSLPLLVAPPGISVRDAHQAIVFLLADRQAATAERGMQLYRKLSEMSREEQGLQAMTDVMSKLTGKIVVVQDKRLEVRAISSPRTTDIDESELIEVLMQRDELPAVLRNRKAAAKARQSYWQQLLPVKNLARLVSPIISGDRARGYLSVVGPADQLDMLDSLTVEHGAAACALEMAKAKAVSEAKKSLRGDFLEGLLAGTLPQKEIDRLAGRLDHDTTQPHAVMTFAWNGPESPSLRRLETTINWLLRNHPRPALVHIYGDQHACVFQSLKSVEDMDSAHELARRLLEQIDAEYPATHLIGGISGPALTLADWPQVYHEALQAMQMGQRLKMNQVVEFDSLGIYRLLGRLENIPAVVEFTDQVIGPLVHYDDQHRSTLVQTLDAYFNHHGNISQTAEALFIHRNTLLYRLDRIQELTNHNLNQANMRLALQLALKLWQLRPESPRIG
ncbi:MAG: helix-turn-helix domain-containing protein [Ardenticatenaceae bacterium]|nr:helix-turn-helix domain-containing protein [Ardenticatenaceae bacterium]